VKLNRDIFKAYDIRGIYPTDIDEAGARAIGQAFAAYLGSREIAVGYDMRLSSPSLKAGFVDGVTEQGVDVTDYGMLSTDMMYFAVASANHSGGAQITASHNPKQYNGMKLVREGAFPLSGDAGINDIRDMIENGEIPPPAKRRGEVTNRSVLDAYVEHVMSFIDPTIVKPFNVVLDAGSGTAAIAAPRCFDRLPCKTTKLCFDIDGNFPNHEANPLIEENRRDITDEVIRQKADVGIAWDGDADRCFFIDETGDFIAGDFVTALLAQAFLLKQPGATIIYDVRASWAVKDIVTAHGGKALMNRVGHAFIKRRMRETNAVFGGEVTGHYYFRDNYYCDNGLIPALMMLELMSKHGKSLHQLLAPLREKYFISGEINTKLAHMDRVEPTLDTIAKKYADGKQYRLDGLSVEYPDWHFNVRPSNTEPLLRLNLEAKTPTMMAEKRDEVLALIRS
jgi:phosphomannomutase